MDPKLTPSNTILIGINVAVFVILSCLGDTESAGFMLQHGAMEWRSIMECGEYYRIFTSMFLHFGFEHIFENMIFLFLIGSYLEEAMGSVRYFIFYLLCGVGSGLCSLAVDMLLKTQAVSAGASGAIFGIVGALLYVAIRNHGRVGEISTRGLVLMAGLSLYYGFTAQGVDNAAHIGGLISGFLLAVLTYWKHKPKHY